ncbi:MAG: phage/plasmid primase, P4 family, partial [Sphingomonas bacterium]|nr:phage/plasmid primase, P4 family [Sphingomonas bacterium]
PVFPCRERDDSYVNRKGETVILKAKAPYTGNGLKDATTDEQRIRAWWGQHPDAMIGLPTGVNGCIVIDFDPRIEEEVDAGTGEVVGQREWTLDQLKADIEAQLGCAMPVTLTSRTPSGGVHVWYRQPDDGGAPLRNRGVLPDHVDARGLGGYVIGPPSRCLDGSLSGSAEGEYRWIERRGDWRDDAAIEAAPAALITRLRATKAEIAAIDGIETASPAAPRRATPADRERAVDDDVRKYALAALDGECRAIREAPSGRRNAQLNTSALKIASLAAAGAIEERFARLAVESAARDNPGKDDDAALMATVNSGWTAGISSPRDLSEIASASRSRRERAPSRAGPARAASSAPRPGSIDDGEPSSHAGGWGSNIGGNGAGGADDPVLTRECAFLPHTDLGNLERFLKRHGGDFLYVEQWGWLAWDGRRWNRDMAVSLMGRAIQDTMRTIQDEAKLIEASGIPVPPMELFDAEQLRAHELQQKGKFDRIAKPATARAPAVLFSATIAKWGRTSEGAGHIACIAKMAEARLSARPDDFDADPMMLNVANGTIEFRGPGVDDRGERHSAQFRLREARRADRITKIAAVAFEPAATCPRYDAFLAEVQPSADMREFLDCWGGYNALGLTNAQKMALYYGEGSNGKSVDMDVKAHILGDYARVCGIETFIDQGKYRKGSDASPDLAALAGRRMVRASEPEDGSKFSDGLIKAMTGSEPMPVRELLKPPFEMTVTFKVTVSANNKPKIGTDHGIQRRMQLVPWDVIIPDDRQDTQLTAKLKAEGSGILNRMVRGAIRYLDDGLPVPEAVREATMAYHAENDVLGQFLALCIVRMPGETIGSTALHELFAAWQTWAQLLPATGKPWSPKYLAAQMEKKRFKKRKSSSMVWDDIAANYDRHDFVDHDGRPVTTPLPPPKHDAARPGPLRAGVPDDDDDLPP